MSGVMRFFRQSFGSHVAQTLLSVPEWGAGKLAT
jgi:hypothetical protein